MGDSEEEEELQDHQQLHQEPVPPPGYRRCPGCRQLVQVVYYPQHFSACRVRPFPSGRSTHGAALQRAGSAEELALGDDFEGGASKVDRMDDDFDGAGLGTRGGVEGAPTVDDTGLELQQQQDRRKEQMDTALAARKAEGARRVSLRDLQMLRIVLQLDEASASAHMRDEVRVRQSPAACPSPKHCALTHCGPTRAAQQAESAAALAAQAQRRRQAL